MYQVREQEWISVTSENTHRAETTEGCGRPSRYKFHRFVIDERKLCAYAMSEIGNMDETPMYFDMPGNTSVDFVVNKTIGIKTTGHEKQHFTVVLACLADGTKLKPMVIFKRKTMPNDKCPSVVLVKVQEKGWMNESLTHTWLDEIWFKRSGSLLNPLTAEVAILRRKNMWYLLVLLRSPIERTLFYFTSGKWRESLRKFWYMIVKCFNQENLCQMYF